MTRDELKTTAKRSELMSKVRQKGTSAEKQIRKMIRRMGISFDTNAKDLPGSPDLSNKNEKWAIFVNGCFWHAHEGCSRSSIPKSNRNYWIAKFKRNKERDRRKEANLQSLGYSVLVIWECEIEKVAYRKLNEFFRFS